MPEQRNINVESSPHFDGERESIINDPAGGQSDQIGVTSEQKQGFHRNRTTNKLETDEDMREFEKLMRGKKLN